MDGRRVSGVRYVRGGHQVSVKARREVIVSAGAIHSPHLLMLSGIGDALCNLPLPAFSRCMTSWPSASTCRTTLRGTSHYRSRVPTLNQQLNSWTGKALGGYALPVEQVQARCRPAPLTQAVL
jgi:choline dehydrogenase